VFVDARRAVWAVAAVEGDLAEQEMLFELAPLIAGGSAMLRAVRGLRRFSTSASWAAMCSGRPPPPSSVVNR